MTRQIATALPGAVLAASAQAWTAGDVMVHAGAAGVMPTGESDPIPALSGARIEAQDAWSPGITLACRATNSIGVGVPCAWPFEHDVDVVGGGEIAGTRHLPPTVTLQYHFDTGSGLLPYVGAGVNCTPFFDEDIKLSGAALELDDSRGQAGELGVDRELRNDWLVAAQVVYIGIDTEAGITAAPRFDVDINPWVAMSGAGRRLCRETA